MRLKSFGPNQTEVAIGSWLIFFSYETPVAAMETNGKAYVTTRKHSVTTSKHVRNWLMKRQARDRAEKPQEWFDSLTGHVQMV